MYKFVRTLFYLFALFGVLFIPFPFYVFPFQESIVNFLFKDILVFVSENVFGIHLVNSGISSDSTLMYILVLILFAFAVLFSAILTFSHKLNSYKWFAFFRKICCYYLALQLLKYGFDKVFKHQFYMPEPNILYTPFGQLDKDILYWSTMGTSYSYSVFLGLLEVISAIFILFRKTRTLGLLIALGIMTNVVAINFGFDISVKIYSLFLLFLSIFLLVPQLKRLYGFLVLQQTIGIKEELESFSFFSHTFWKPTSKIFVICIIFTEALYPFFNNQNFNDDLTQKSFLHGAYEVTENPSVSTSIKRFFIHKDGFIIFQNEKDRMEDFELYIDKYKHQFVLTDYHMNQTKYNYSYNENDSLLELQYFIGNKEYILKAKSLDWSRLRVVQNKFHWMIDGG